MVPMPVVASSLLASLFNAERVQEAVTSSALMPVERRGFNFCQVLVGLQQSASRAKEAKFLIIAMQFNMRLGRREQAGRGGSVMAAMNAMPRTCMLS